MNINFELMSPRLIALRCLQLAVAAAVVGGCAKPVPHVASTPHVRVIDLAPQQVMITTRLSGRASAYMTSEVRPQIEGIIQKRLFTEGQDVKAGQVLYQIDPRPYQATYDSARADLLKAKAAVRSAKPKAARYHRLLHMDAVSKQDWEDARATLDSDEAAAAADEAALESARIRLGYTRIAAPISGRIGRSIYTPGALVTAGQESVLTTIQDLDPIYVDVTQSSAQMLALREQIKNGVLRKVDDKVKVSIQLEGGSTYAYPGALEFVGTTVDTGTGNVTLRIAVPNPDHTILPGMYVRALLPIAYSKMAFVIPQHLVNRDAEGVARVKLVDSKGTVQERVVKPAYAFKDKWVVTGGLKTGDKLIVDGASRVSSGQHVKAVATGAKGQA